MDISAVVYVLLVICQGSFQTDIGGGVLPLSPATGRAPVPGRAPDAPWRPRRFKRCSCSSLMDKECVYFCHLDIIWINTPEQTVPYGLGNTRSRRALEDKKPFTSNDRCQCSIGRDKKCKTFCQTEADLRAQSAMEKGVSTVNKEECRGLGLKCVQRLSQHNRSMKRSEMIDNNIQVSLRIAKLKASLEWMQRTRHNRTNKKQNIWERLKKTP